MSHVRVVIQARTTSTRLPGKALLPLAGLPSAILCALRAKNRGADVVLATSTDATDDRLAAAARAHGVRLVRGPLEDVLARYHKAAADLSPEAVVVRLTADNPFPDGRFVESLVAQLRRRRLDYLGTNSPLDGLPYGVAGEAFTVSALRAAQRSASSASDREHVTPWISRERGAALFVPEGPPRSLAHLRCTLDELRDYLTLAAVFDRTRDPVALPWTALCRILQALPGQPSWRVPFRVLGETAHGELTLGTAQWGMAYGIANRRGQPSEAEAAEMVQRALRHGVQCFDTARDYGDSEAVLGRIFQREFPGRGTLVTKLSALPELGPAARPAAVHAAVDSSILRSCLELRRPILDTVLLHRWEHHAAFGGRVWGRLLELKASGRIRRLGASVCSPKEGLGALADPDIEHIQLPFNLLDHRWKQEGFVEAARRRRDVVIHARSALLQGLLVSPPRLWPRLGSSDPGRWARKIASLARRLGRDGPLDLCIAYVRAQPWLTSIVMGMESRGQLDENMRLFRRPVLTEAECRSCESELAGAPERLLDPSRWPAAGKRRKEIRHGKRS